MKSSRRKQTNPNRIATGPCDLSLTVLPCHSEALKIPLQETDAAEYYMPNNQLSQTIFQPTGLTSSDRSLTSEYLAGSLNQNKEEDCTNKTQLPELKQSRLEDTESNFPTAYHKLGRELQNMPALYLNSEHLHHKVAFVPQNEGFASISISDNLTLQSEPDICEKLEEKPSHSPSPSQPFTVALKSSPSGGDEYTSTKTDKIFHMDAYCDLCDREFCNKYFLKTHKANKHGIYEDSSPPINNVPGVIMPTDPSVLVNYKPDAIKPKLLESLLPWTFKPDSHLQQVNTTAKTSNGNSLGILIQNLPVPSSQVEDLITNINTSNKTIPNGDAYSWSSSTTGSNSSLVSTSMANNRSFPCSVTTVNDSSMEDYCHICQKHFCNKYYLRKHKQDVHGIAPEISQTSSSKRVKSDHYELSVTSAKRMMYSQSFENVAEVHNLYGMSDLASMPCMPNLSPGVMVINPYSLPSVAIIPTSSLMPGHQIPSSVHLAPTQSMDPSYHPKPDILSSASTSPQATSPGQPSSGDIKTGVHCQICTKEFSNNLYLGIHLDIKHGITSSAENRSQPLLAEKPFEVQSPLKLSKLLKPESRFIDKPNNSENILVCNFCNEGFTNTYLYSLHRIHKHGFLDIFDKTRLENGELQSKESLFNNSAKGIVNWTPNAAVISSTSRGDTSAPNKPECSIDCNMCNEQSSSHHLLYSHAVHAHDQHASSGEKQENSNTLSDFAITKPNTQPCSCIPLKIPPFPLCSGKPSQMPPTPPSLSRPLKTSPSPPCSTKPSKTPPNTLSCSEKLSKTPPSSTSEKVFSPSQQSIGMTTTPSEPLMFPFLPPKVGLDIKNKCSFEKTNPDFLCWKDIPSFVPEKLNNDLFTRSQGYMKMNFFGLLPGGSLPMNENFKLNFDPNIKLNFDPNVKLNFDPNFKLNFDPEAFCEICKKEFCSKYFLKTHKQNIHGIKSELISAHSIQIPDTDQKSLDILKKSVFNSNEDKVTDGLEKDLWRWKESENTSRVVCHICNKEVCNKYFLRTHKQKKHGTVPKSLSPNDESTSGSPVVLDCDTTSCTSIQREDKLFQFETDSLPQAPLPNHTEKLSDPLQMRLFNFGKVSKEILKHNHKDHGETCNMCQRLFKGGRSLKDHIVNDHTATLNVSYKNYPRIFTCHVCDDDFPSEISVQIHLIQVHNARIILDTERSNIPKAKTDPKLDQGSNTNLPEIYRRTIRQRLPWYQRMKKYVCSRCRFDTNWLSLLLDHERKRHKLVSDQVPAYRCQKCQHWSPSSHSLAAHVTKFHGLLNVDYEPTFSKSKRPNSYKCVQCSATFLTRYSCIAHIRQLHIRTRRDFTRKHSFVKDTLRCSFCSYHTHFAIRLKQHAKLHNCSGHLSSNPAIQPLQPPSPVISSTSGSNNPTDVSSPSRTFTEDRGLISTSAVCKSITSSILSTPESPSAKTTTISVDTKGLVFQSYKLPLCSADSTSFKRTIKTSASAVLHL